jgi:hypothetical protein
MFADPFIVNLNPCTNHPLMRLDNLFPRPLRTAF